MEVLKMPSTSPERGVGASHAAPVLIATDGRPQSDSALALGQVLTDTPDEVRVISVIRPLPKIPEAPFTTGPSLESALLAEANRELVTQMRRVWTETADVDIRIGDPATEIARAAEDAKATMIVAGLGRHRVSDRVFGDETALRLIRLSTVPVLAVAKGVASAPRRIVVAMDFSQTSLRAARLALEIAAPEATIYLAHVAPRDGSLYDWNNWGTSYRADAGEALRKTREQLQVPAGMHLQSLVLQGDTATELLAFAASVNADLIATGNHGHGFVARMLIGSVTTRIVRCSTCSVLTVPHAAVRGTERARELAPVAEAIPTAEWMSGLDEFTRRNIGRRGVLEVDDPEIGAQAQEFDYPLMGTAYDPHDRRVEMMFGESRSGSRHLTRGIAGATGIDVLRDGDGRDLAIRVQHGAGQTLLTFSS